MVVQQWQIPGRLSKALVVRLADVKRIDANIRAAMVVVDMLSGRLAFESRTSPGRRQEVRAGRDQVAVATAL